MANNTSRSGNPAVRAGTHGKPQTDVSAKVVAWIALGIALLSAAGTWAQVVTDREAISEQLTMRTEVRAYDELAKEYGEVVNKGQRAPALENHDSALYVIASVTNLGKGSGVIAGMGLSTADGGLVNFEGPTCQNLSRQADNAPCYLPMTIPAGEIIKFYLAVPEDRLIAFGCAESEAAIEAFVTDSTGQKFVVNSEVRAPRSDAPCVSSIPSD